MMEVPGIVMPLLFAACMPIVTGIRSVSRRPRRWITFILARQLWQPWQPVSANGGKAYGFRLSGDRLISQGSVVGWVDCGGECDDWLVLRGFAYPAIIEVVVQVVI